MGIPFVLVGQYMIGGRFLYSAWKRKRTHYAVTSRRVLVVQDGWKRQMASAYIDTLPTLIKEGNSSVGAALDDVGQEVQSHTGARRKKQAGANRRIQRMLELVIVVCPQ